jgi:alcohol dehydrogenase-like protein
VLAVRLHEDGLKVEEIEAPSPGPGEVLVRVHAAAITRDELEWPVDRLPAIPSYELSGVVVDSGDEVSFRRAHVVPRRLRLWLFGCTLGRIAFFVLTPALYLLAVQLSGAVGFLTAPVCLLAFALTSPFVMGVAVGVGGAPAPAHVVADFPHLVQHHHHRLAPERNAREEFHIGHAIDTAKD